MILLEHVHVFNQISAVVCLLRGSNDHGNVSIALGALLGSSTTIFTLTE